MIFQGPCSRYVRAGIPKGFQRLDRPPCGSEGSSALSRRPVLSPIDPVRDIPYDRPASLLQPRRSLGSPQEKYNGAVNPMDPYYMLMKLPVPMQQAQPGESGINLRGYFNRSGDLLICILCITCSTHASGDHRKGHNQFSASNPWSPIALWWHRSFAFRTPEDGKEEGEAMRVTLWICS